ncbi:MAG: serine hydrolase, partial [Spirochaetales bacterium]|nr:serine hydrolase [Spirochaetales bacterium]
MKVHASKYSVSMLLILINLSGCTTAHKQPAIFPGENWQRSTPEAQGMDSKMLLDAFKLMDLPKSAINSMVVIRNGYIIAEYYRQPYTKETRHMINSSTKSFTSALMGIAIDEGI